ncbi:hypothetical protein CHS0354_017534 [Potamilus streckersoni]|uniref:Annexin n=1 Tax=Potamilus streckersoni TaxID=2493646 RepID=A0AAE0TFX7_9BIVA|nr:hypothetical protein CHS0354_017534 [Potamilus streckersoni]
MPRHVTSLGGSSFATSSKILQKYEQDRMYQIHKQKLANSKHMLNNSRPGTYPHLILRLKQIQKEEERQAEVDHDNKILLNRMTRILKYGGKVDNWNDYESRSLNYPYRERQTQKIARENRGIAYRLEKVRPVYQRKKWDSEYKQHEYLRSMLAESTKDYTKLTPRRYNSRISKARSLDTGLSQAYEDDFESDHEEEEKTKLPKLVSKKEKHENLQSKDSVKNETKSVKLPQIQQNQNQMQQGENKRMERDRNAGTTEDNSDIALLFKAAKKMAKPDEVFIKVLVKKSHKQRMPLKEKFRQKYDLDLMTELKSGLGLDWERLIDALLQEQGVSDAFAVFDALSTSEYIDIIEILCARDNAGISELNDSYRQEFSISLEEDITDRTEPPVQTLLLALVKGHKEGSGEMDPKEAWNDAKELHESGDDRWTGESGKFVKLLTEKPLAHLKSVLTEFKDASGGRDILEIVKEECPADYNRALAALINYIKGPAMYYAEVLFRHKVSSNDSIFVSTLVTRSEIDMPMVRKLYKKKYDSDLVEDIKPHPTRTVLVALASKIPPTTKTKESLSKITYGRGGPPSAIRQQQSTPRKQNHKKVRQPDEASIAASIDSNPHNQPSRRGHAEAAKQQEMKEKLHEDGDHNGTVKPARNFNAHDDCERLQKAMDGGAADMEVIISIIPKRSNKQRQELKRKYDEKFKKNLMIELEEELQGDFEEIVLALMMMPHEYDAYCVHEAVEGLGTSDATLLGIIGTRSGREMRAIKEHYKKAHKLDMEKDVVADISSPFAHLLVQLIQGNRETGSDVNTKEAEEDAKKLYKDGKPIDPDDSTFKDLLAKKNHAQIKAIFEEYKKIAGTDIYTSLKNANLGDDEDSFITIAKAIEDPVHFYAEKLHDCFSGLGTNDNMLIRIVVSRSEMDLIDIKEKYQELYSKSLSESVQNECKGDYKYILLAIIGDK